MTHPAQKDVTASRKRQKAWVEGRARGGKVDRPGKAKKRADGGASDNDSQLRPGTTYFPGKAAGQSMPADGGLREGETMTIDHGYRAAREKEMQETGRAFGGAAERRNSQSKVDDYPTGAAAHEGAKADGRARGGSVSASGYHKPPETKAVDDRSAENLRAAGGSIHIKPSHRGMLHRELGVPPGEKIPAAKMEAAKAHASPAERKRITFAENAKKWNH